jgi:hypothetical protein
MTLYDVLTFRTMVTPSVLLIVYYAGALGMPLFAYSLFRRVYGRYRRNGGTAEKKRAAEFFSAGWRVRLLFLLFFLMAELAWRIFIEFFVAYFQIREALLG